MDYDVPKPSAVQQAEQQKAADAGKAKNTRTTVLPAKQPTADRKQAAGAGPWRGIDPGFATRATASWATDLEAPAAEADKPIVEKSGENDQAKDKLDQEAREKQPLARGQVKLDSISDKMLADTVRGLAKEYPDLEARIMRRFAEAAAPVVNLPLPDEAPRLWEDRPADERGMNAAAWIRLVYAPWLGHGLARHHVGELDPVLGRAYSSWTRKERHPEDAIAEFAEGNPRGRIEDARQAVENRRSSDRMSKARKRATDKVTQVMARSL